MEPEQRREIARRGGESRGRQRGESGRQGARGRYEEGDERELRGSWDDDDQGGRRFEEEDERGGRGRDYDEDEYRGSRNSGSSRRGFAAMDPERQREIARMGGIASHRKGVGHEWTSEEARVCGAKGGHAPHRRQLSLLR